MMLKQNGNAKVWLLIGALVVVVGAILYFDDNFPPSGKDASGTIVPAERYRADQISGEDVVLVPAEDPDDPPALHIPDPSRAIGGGGQDAIAGR